MTTYLNSQSLNVVCPISPPREIRQVELNLVPAIIQSHGHRTYKRLHSGGTLVIACTESSSYIFIIQDLKYRKITLVTWQISLNQEKLTL